MFKSFIKQLRKIRKETWMIKALPYSIYFNLRYLPFKIGYKVPILLYKGHIKIIEKNALIIAEDCPIKFGMIKLGIPYVSVYPNDGIHLEIKGRLIFKGKCLIGNNSYISVGENGVLTIGKEFVASTALKMVCHHIINIGNEVRAGWENLFCDTDFHTIKYENGGHSKGYSKIEIGDNSWLGMKCITLKGSVIPPKTIVGAGSLVNRPLNTPPCSLVAGNPPVLKRTGLWRDIYDDVIDYPPIEQNVR